MDGIQWPPELNLRLCISQRFQRWNIKRRTLPQISERNYITTPECQLEHKKFQLKESENFEQAN